MEIFCVACLVLFEVFVLTHIRHMAPAGGLETILDIGIFWKGVDGRAYAVSKDNVHQFQRWVCCIRTRFVALVNWSVHLRPRRLLGLRLTVKHTDCNNCQDNASGQRTHCEYLFSRAATEYHFWCSCFLYSQRISCKRKWIEGATTQVVSIDKTWFEQISELGRFGIGALRYTRNSINSQWSCQRDCASGACCC